MGGSPSRPDAAGAAGSPSSFGRLRSKSPHVEPESSFRRCAKAQSISNAARRLRSDSAECKLSKVFTASSDIRNVKGRP